MSTKLNELTVTEFVELLENTKTRKPKSPYLTYEELSDYLQISKTKLERLKRSGRIPYNQVDGIIRFNRNLIDLWLSTDGNKTSFTARDKKKLEVLC